jgi:acetylornithine deacetylase/succinyl-diaminopimelate desuccinylase-like protein
MMDQRVLEWCKRLIECPSVTGEGTREIAELCARELLSPHGIEARLLPSEREGDRQVNLVARVVGTDHAAAPLVLNTHLDTVPPGDQTLWSQCGGDPFDATVDGDRIYGLGAADTKLDFVAKAIALTTTDRPRRDICLLATFGEEHGLAGAKEISASGILPRGALAFVGEPSRLEVVTAHKGLMAFELRIGFAPIKAQEAPGGYWRLTFAGRSAHSSTPRLGRNAIKLGLDALLARPDIAVSSIDGGDAINKVPASCSVIIAGGPQQPSPDARLEPVDYAPAAAVPAAAIVAAARFVSALEQYADSAGTAEPDYAPPTLTCNPGVISSNPDSLVLKFELRPPPGLALDTVRAGLQQLLQELVRGNPELKLEVIEERANPGFRGALDSETVELALKGLAAAGLPLNTSVKAGCTEAGIYAAAGLRPVVFGPGPSTGVIHAPNEYNLLSDVHGAVQFYTELLRL